jgi:signal transduction histidine kinase/DNA-binding response OmpR family regulator
MATIDLSEAVTILSERKDKGRERILVVDDDVAMQQMLQVLLQSEGHAVDLAASGREALAKINTAQVEQRPYALALIDLQLGDISGLEVLRQLGESCPAAQSVIITGHADVSSAVAALRQGAQDYLLKPYRIDELKAITAKLLIARREALRNAALLADARRRANELAVLNHVGQTVSRSLDLEEVLALIMEEIRDALQVEACSIALLEDEDLVFKVALGPAAEKVKAFTLKPGQGFLGYCVAEAKPLLVNDAQDDERHFRIVDEKTRFCTRSLLCVPMTVSKGKVIGAIEAINRLDGQGFSQNDLELLKAISVPASVAVENARLHENLSQHADELAEALTELRELDRLKSEFIQNVSHELRTPLTLIGGYVEFLQGEMLGQLQPEQRHSLQIVQEQTDKLTRLVNDIILMQECELDAKSQELVSLRDLITDVVCEFGELHPEREINLDMDGYAAGSCFIWGNPAYLSRAFQSLVDNALKFDPEGKPVEVRLQTAGGGWKIWVRDQGIGIPEAEFDKIFQRFYQVDGSSTRQFNGVGLGLAAAKEIIEVHGGYIWVDSRVNEGSTFGVWLPGIRHKDSLGIDETAKVT